MKRVFSEARAVELAAFAIDHQTDYLRIMKESLKKRYPYSGQRCRHLTSGRTAAPVSLHSFFCYWL